MRSVACFAVAILLLGLKNAGAEIRYQDSDVVADKHTLASPLGFNISVERPDREFASPSAGDASATSPDEENHAAQPSQSPNAGFDGAAQAGDKTIGRMSKTPSVADLCNALFASAEDNSLPVPFFANLLWQESGLRLDVVSHAGAKGIAQFMPQSAAEVGLRDPFDPNEAIPASARFLRALREQFSNLGFVAAAYNAGPHRVTDWLDHGRTLPDETKHYVVSVTGRSAEAWRKSPVADSALTFVRSIPCRVLPAFANLEKTQMRLAQTQPQPPQEKIEETIEKIASAATNAARRIIKAITADSTYKTDKKASVVAHRRGRDTKIASAEALVKLARNIHGSKPEAARLQHGLHEKRKVALR